MDLQSILGYSSGSPYGRNPYLDINTPTGLIDMSNTPINLIGIDNKGNKKKMKAGRKNPYRFDGNIVREIPMSQIGGIPNPGYGMNQPTIKDALENAFHLKTQKSGKFKALIPLEDWNDDVLNYVDKFKEVKRKGMDFIKVRGKIPPGYHQMPDGSIMSNDKMMQQGGVYGSDEEVNAANKFTQNFLLRHNEPNAINMVVARKPGDPRVQFQYTSASMPDTTKRANTLPRGVSVDQVFLNAQGQYGYIDPVYDNWVPVDANSIYSLYGQKPVLPATNSVARAFRRGGRMQTGGKMVKSVMASMKEALEEEARQGVPDRSSLDYTIKNRNSKQQYPVNSGNIKQVIATAIGMGYDPKKAISVALQETGLGRVDDNLFHIKGSQETTVPYTPNYFIEQGIQSLKDKEKYAKRLGYSSPEMQLQAFNGLGKIFPDTERGYHGFRMKKIYGVPIPKEGIDMKQNPLYGKRILDLKNNAVDKDPLINQTIDYYNKFYSNPDSVYYTTASDLPNVTVRSGNKQKQTFQKGGYSYKDLYNYLFQDDNEDDYEDIKNTAPSEDELPQQVQQQVQEEPDDYETTIQLAMQQDDLNISGRNPYGASVSNFLPQRVPGVNPYSGSPENVTSSANINNPSKYAFEFFKNKGLPAHVAAGIVGNLIQESGNFRPDVVSDKIKGDQGTSHGIAQWHKDRWPQLQKWATSQGKNPLNLDTQLEYVYTEANQRGDLQKTLSAQTPEEAANIFAKYYERPAIIDKNRARNARNLYQQ